MAKRTFLIVVIGFFLAGMIWLGSSLSTPRIFLNQRRATHSVFELIQAERSHAARLPDAGYACKLSDLGEQGLVDSVLASGTKAGYRFEIRCPQNGIQKAESFTVTAIPVSLGLTGQYSLCGDQSGEVWYSENTSISDCLTNHKPVPRKYRN
jgi:hypothetical protein